jgi:hypothetical protein
MNAETASKDSTKVNLKRRIISTLAITAAERDRIQQNWYLESAQSHSGQLAMRLDSSTDP